MEQPRLPPEVVFEFLKYADITSLYKLYLTSKEWANLVSGFLESQRRLIKYCVLDSPRSQRGSLIYSELDTIAINSTRSSTKSVNLDSVVFSYIFLRSYWSQVKYYWYTNLQRSRLEKISPSPRGRKLILFFGKMTYPNICSLTPLTILV